MRLLSLLLTLQLLYPVTSYAIQVVTGSYTGNSTDNRDITISPACQPKVVIIHRSDSQATDSVMRLDSMSGDNASQISSSVGFAANIIQQFNSNGFQVGTSGASNASAQTYRYIAICDNGANDIATGTYTGDGTDNANITISPAFQPEIVFIVPNAAGLNIFRSASGNSGDQACFFNSSVACAANYIQQFNSDGFQRGSAANTNATAYYYFAVKGNALGVTSGNFTGNATDNRDITVGFQPKLVILKGDSATSEGAMRMESNSGDESACNTAGAVTNIIQAFGATTFQVGTDSCANENTKTMRWFALTDVLPRKGSGLPLYVE